MEKYKFKHFLKRILKYLIICFIIFIFVTPILFMVGLFPVPYDVKSDKSTDDILYMLEDDDLSEKHYER